MPACATCLCRPARAKGRREAGRRTGRRQTGKDLKISIRGFDTWFRYGFAYSTQAFVPTQPKPQSSGTFLFRRRCEQSEANRTSATKRAKGVICLSLFIFKWECDCFSLVGPRTRHAHIDLAVFSPVVPTVLGFGVISHRVCDAHQF